MLNKFGQCFSPAVQEQGQALFQRGLVQGVFGSDEDLRVEILDAGGAEASWHVSRNRLVPNCSCENFQAGQLCAHLWAALLLADSQGDLRKALRKCVAGKISLSTPSPAAADQEPDYQLLEPYRPGRRRPPLDDAAQEPQMNMRLRRRVPAPEPVLPGLNPACDSPEILYVLCEDKLSGQDDFLCLETWWRQQHPDGKASCRPFYPEAGSQVSSRTDFQTLALLLRSRQALPDASGNEFKLRNSALQEFFALQAGSRYLRWAPGGSQGRQFHRLQIPEVFAAELEFSFVQKQQGHYEVLARMQTAERAFALEEIGWLGLCGAAVAGGCLFQLHFAGAEGIAWELWQAAKQQIKARTRTYSEALALARSLFLAGNPEDKFWPRELRCEVRRVQVHGVLFVKTDEYKFAGREQLHADLSFDYEGRRCTATEQQARLPGNSLNQVLERDFEAEAGLQERLLQLGFYPKGRKGADGYRLLPAKLEDAVLALVMEDWLVTAAGRTYCKPGEKKALVKGAGLDWFEINGEVDFKGQKMPLPKLLQALQRGASSVRLDDGTYGILPREWLEKFTALTEIGETSDQRILLQRRQAALVQALLRERLQDADGQFTAVAEALQHPPVPQPQLPPEGFQGTLRPYQQDGLGWLLTMRDLGLGGCLADDMGLGKTVQVLALLCWQKQSGTGKTSLIVAPKSLLFNWMSEAARFAPALRCRCYAGPGRERILAELQQSDLLLTTYGTLRADVELLSRCEFDYCILDESQAIKNSDSATAKAVRTIKAEHRLAMTGTPIENRLSELFSQLEFLNPGLLGEKFLAGCSRIVYDLSEEQAVRLRRAIHPFLLRRTKADVAKDLPVKTEKVLFCELDEAQQQSYAELKEFYRQELLQTPESGGGKLKALAALLRLRQAACHPGLLDARLASQPSAKLEVLLERLHTLAEAGQKALIFSQFSKFLRLLEPHLQQQGLQYCYLDGQTQNRGELVQQFQNDPRTLFFLISLKAGGTGLNLTAAEYVFLLDPWWNPAAESQAIDRAYRIGQKKPVFAYRLIAKDTVEEKVLQMQEAKRSLASTLLAEAPQKGLPLQLEDLRFLLQ